MTQETMFKEFMVTARALAANPNITTSEQIVTATAHIMSKAFEYAQQCKTEPSQPQQPSYNNGGYQQPGSQYQGGGNGYGYRRNYQK